MSIIICSLEYFDLSIGNFKTGYRKKKLFELEF